MQNLLKGARYLLQGFRLIHLPGIRRFAYFPMAINTVLFSIAIWFGFGEFDHWMHALMPSWLPHWLASIVMWILWPLFFLLIALLVFFTFSIVANILASPFNGILAEAVEHKLSGQPIPVMSWGEIIKDAPKMIFSQIRKLGYTLLWMIPLLIVTWVPVINVASPVLWALFSSWMLALDYHDFPMGNHQMLFEQQRAILRQQRGLAMGFGLATLGATMIPFINFLVIPAAVAGATALYLENLKQV